MLPQIATSMDSVELIAMATGIGSYKIGEQAGFPFDQTSANVDAGDCVIPVNLANNVTQLHAFLFGDTAYVPSETVVSVSNEISARTGIY